MDGVSICVVCIKFIKKIARVAVSVRTLNISGIYA